MSATGGITEGKSHKEGGIPMVVKSTGQKVELEGGEGVINKRNMASDKKFEFQGKKMTTCEIASEINSANGNGVQIDCDNVTGKKYEYATGGKILDEEQESSFKEWMDDGNVVEFEKGVYSTQDAQYRNRLKGMDELRKYFRKEFLSDSYEGGGNIEWSKAEIGDSARVKSENKMGLIIKDYGRKFHLKFADNTEKTYDASELDFYRLDEEDEYAGGGNVPKSNKMFHLPLELAVYVPSTQDVDVVISDTELNERVNEVSKYLAKIFGGFTKSEKVGGFMTSQSELVTEDVVPVVSFATKDDYEANKNKLVNKLSEWARKWGQEAIGFEFEGDLYYVPQKFEKGGDVRDFDWYQMWKKDQVKKGTEHELEHKDTIEKFKKEGVSDEEVAKAIAEDHLDEDENYYIELDKMESSKKVSDAIEDFEKQKSHRKSKKKYNVGGYTGEQRAIVHIVFSEDYIGIIRRKDGKYLTESVFPKGKVYKFTFLLNDGTASALEFANTGSYMLVPNEIINIVGFDEEKYGNGGAIKPYQSLNLGEHDKKIVKLLLKIDDTFSVDSSLSNKLSTFKGNNIANELSPSIIQKIYGLLFEYHNISNRIENLYLSNIGVGNILSYAPNYLSAIMVSFDEKNQFAQIEKEISEIVNRGKRSFLYNEFEIKRIDAIIHVYPQSNPLTDNLCQLLYKTEKKGIALGVCEFSTMEKLQKFQNSISVNQGSMAQNQMMIFTNSKKFLVVKEGITSEANYTLIYTLTKY